MSYRHPKAGPPLGSESQFCTYMLFPLGGGYVLGPQVCYDE